jgi:hypothetical protein
VSGLFPHTPLSGDVCSQESFRKDYLENLELVEIQKKVFMEYAMLQVHIDFACFSV